MMTLSFPAKSLLKLLKLIFVSLLSLCVVAIKPINAQTTADNHIVDIGWNSTGDLIATMDYSGTIRVVTVSNQQVLFMSNDNGYGSSFSWHPLFPEQLAISTLKHGTSLIDVNTGFSLRRFDTDANTYSVSFHPSGEYIVTSHGTPNDGPLARGYIVVAEISTGTPLLVFEEISNRVVSAEWSPEGNFIAGLNVGELGEVVVWNFITGEIVTRLSEMQQANDDQLGTYYVGNISNFSWNPHGETIILATELQLVTWDTATFDRLNSSEFLLIIEDIDWNPVNQLVAVAKGDEQQIQLVNTCSGQVVDTVATTFAVSSVSWNPTGTQLAFAGNADGLFEVLTINSEIIGLPPIK